jgi:hypothetical protein
MIGPANRVPGPHAPQIEPVLAFTAPGQATWAHPTIPHTCSECAHWAALNGRGKNVWSLSRILCAHARPPWTADRKKTAGVRCVRARRKGDSAMSEHDREVRLERVKPTLKILERGAL